MRLLTGVGDWRPERPIATSVRLDRHAGEEDLLQAGDDDLVVRHQAGLHHAQAVMDAAEHDVLALRLVSGPST